MDGSLLCRICIAADTDVIMISIFGEDGLYQKIKSFASVEIEEGDSLPQQICMMCARNVLNACSFKRKCEESDRIYRNQLLHKPSVKPIIDSSSKISEVKQTNKEVIDLDESDSDDDDDDENDSDEDDDDDEDDDGTDSHAAEVKFTDEIDKIDLSNPKYSEQNDDDHMDIRNEWNSQSQNTTDDDQLPLIPEIELITPNEEVKVADSHIQGYQCSICFQIFNMRATLNHHIKTFHPESSPSFECFNCRKQYLSKRFLEKHIRRGRCVRKRKNTTRPMRCSGCNVIFPTGHHLGWHKRTGCPSKMSPEDQKRMNVTHVNNLMYRENVLKKMYNFNKFRKPKQKGRSRIKLDALTISYAKQLIAQDATTSKMAQELNISRTFAWRLRKSLISGTNLHSQNGNINLNDIEKQTVPVPSDNKQNNDNQLSQQQQQQKIENDSYLERIANNNSLEMTMITNSSLLSASTKELLKNTQLSEEQIQMIKDNNFSIPQNSEIRFIPIIPKSHEPQNIQIKNNKISNNIEMDSQQMQTQMPKISVVSEKVLKGQNDIDSLQKRIQNVASQQFVMKDDDQDLDDSDDDDDDDDDDSDDVQIDENYHGPQPGCSNNVDNVNKMLFKMLESKMFDPKMLDPKNLNKLLAKMPAAGINNLDNEDSQMFDPKMALQQSLQQYSGGRNSKKPRKQNVFLDEDKYERAKILVANHATTLEIARALDVSQMSAWKLRDSILKGIPLQFRKSTSTHIPQILQVSQVQQQSLQQQKLQQLQQQQSQQQTQPQQQQLQQQQQTQQQIQQQLQQQQQQPQQQKTQQQLQQLPQQEVQIKIEDSQQTQQVQLQAQSSNNISNIIPLATITTTPITITPTTVTTTPVATTLTSPSSSTASLNLLQNGIKLGGRGRVKASVKIERDKQITEIILDFLRVDPSIQYWKITEKLAEKGFIISTSSICQKLKALGFHRRSKGTTTKQESPDNNLNKTSNTSDDNSGSDLFGAHFLGSTFSD
ncbi:MATH and LRR domain-containing protein PFE0570w [Condylostylus longicornis]|uniref:MATH and LRR domain-containing protein PFE0570w n=1 Tax=Condylostylus longicornis TaxID=2530218 RepID=UPI00244E1C8E|nr:MATH and LRR domain-containing protein PFE0570w [Condylostylus longicornis]